MFNTILFYACHMSNYEQFFNQMAFVLIVLLQWNRNVIFGLPCLIKPDSNRITTFEHLISQKMG